MFLLVLPCQSAMSVLPLVKLIINKMLSQHSFLLKLRVLIFMTLCIAVIFIKADTLILISVSIAYMKHMYLNFCH